MTKKKHLVDKKSPHVHLRVLVNFQSAALFFVS